MSYTLPKLPYDYDALEPHIDERTMKIHHDRHHQGYTNKVNKALEGHEFADLPISEVLKRINDVPEDIRQAVINNGGGEPTGAVADAIDEQFGSFDDFKEKFTSTATGQFGSGWGWLCVEDDGNLKVVSTANQNSPYMHGLTPILGLDVWEHAYYLHYQNKRGDYAKAFWNLVNWDKVNAYYEDAQ